MGTNEEMEREYKEQCSQYIEALSKHQELLSQFISCGPVEPGKSITPPKRVLDEAGMQDIKESDQKLDDACQKWHESINRFCQAHHQN